MRVVCARYIVDFVRAEPPLQNRARLGLCVRGKTPPRTRNPKLPNGVCSQKTERDRGNKNTALTTELYDRGALTTNCWPLCFDDVTEVLA